MITEIALGTEAIYQVGRLREQDLFTPEMISITKRNNVKRSLEICREARDILGGNGN